MRGPAQLTTATTRTAVSCKYSTSRSRGYLRSCGGSPGGLLGARQSVKEGTTHAPHSKQKEGNVPKKNGEFQEKSPDAYDIVRHPTRQSQEATRMEFYQKNRHVTLPSKRCPAVAFLEFVPRIFRFSATTLTHTPHPRAFND